MLRYKTWGADRFRFTATGPTARRLPGLAAARGLRLRAVQRTKDGCTATAEGHARTALEALAAQNGWEIRIEARRGPGRSVEGALRRPGVPAGLALFLVLLRLLPGYVWAMDMGALDTQQQQQLRTVLAQNGITEGTRLTAPLLQSAQQAVSMNSEWFGWVSLNFAGGCLYVESTPLERRPIAALPQDTALYAKAAGEVLAVQVDRGFAAVTPGQYVAEGQLLAAATRLDRDGAPVRQSAAGRVLARVERDYTAAEPLRLQCTAVGGPPATALTLYLPGRAVKLTQLPDGATPAARRDAWWEPLHLGALALPACLYRENVWPAQDLDLARSEEAAAALARRACRLALAAEFPDAEVETASYALRRSDGAVTAEAHYVFCADIALSAPDNGEPAP